MTYRAPDAVRAITPAQALGRELSEVEQRYAPATLHIAGDIALLGAAAKVSIVGSRRASAEGLRRAARLAKELVEAGVVVVSGLAEGVDRAAHEAAIEAGGKTVAVIGTSLDRCYPAAHQRLQEDIYRTQLLVSQFPSGHTTRKADFIKRNRTMALLSDASVIVEAADGSGTLSQAAETQRLGRPLFLMRSVVANDALEWPARFLKAGAIPLSSSAQIVDAVRR